MTYEYSEDGLVEVNVGSGFSDAQRKEYFNPKMIGNVIEIKYNEIIDNKFDKSIKSLFLPIFVGTRVDKSKANTLKELK